MPKVNCSVIGYSNSTYKINKRKKETCTEHNLEAGDDNFKTKGDCLQCKPSFHLQTVRLSVLLVNCPSTFISFCAII